MHSFNKHNKIIDLIESNQQLLPVINRFGVNLGNKNLSVNEICSVKNINVEFFITITNTFHNEKYFPIDKLKSFSPLLIIDYLKKTHLYYENYVLPKLESLLQLLIKSSISDIYQLNIIDQFYHKYKEELIVHLKEEEELVFPYMTSIVKGGKANTKYTIQTFEKEHSNVEEKLNDLKNLIINYLEPVYDNNICNEFLIALYNFEKDITNHNRIESKILTPMIINLECK